MLEKFHLEIDMCSDTSKTPSSLWVAAHGMQRGDDSLKMGVSNSLLLSLPGVSWLATLALWSLAFQPPTGEFSQ